MSRRLLHFRCAFVRVVRVAYRLSICLLPRECCPFVGNWPEMAHRSEGDM